MDLSGLRAEQISVSTLKWVYVDHHFKFEFIEKTV
jgi:hypothetical protein